MAQWPFAHEYEMTYSLADGTLEVRLTVVNLSSEPMPLMVGFHPYYRIPDIPRDDWVAHIPARQRVVADERLIPTGEMRPMDFPIQCRSRVTRSTTALPIWSAIPRRPRAFFDCSGGPDGRGDVRAEISGGGSLGTPSAAGTDTRIHLL